MMGEKAIAGTAYIKVDGKQYMLGGSLTISINEYTRTGVAGLSGVAGFTQAAKVPYIEGEFYTVDSFKIKELEKVEDATVTVELVNGRTYMLQEAWQSGDIDVDAAAGTVTIRFEGKRGSEI